MRDTCTGAALATAHQVLTDYLGVTDCRAIWFVTDNGRVWLTDAFASAAAGIGVPLFVVTLPAPVYSEEDLAALKAALGGLGERDLLVINLSAGQQDIRAHALFPAFRSPSWFAGRTAVLRPHYPDAALLDHLATPLAAATSAALAVEAICRPGRVRICAPGGTDLTCELAAPRTLPFRVGPGPADRHVYLPPSEVTCGIVPGTATGTIVVDLTLGEFAVRGEIWDQFGLVPAPLRLTVAGGRVVACEATAGDGRAADASATAFADRLAAHLGHLAAEAPGGTVAAAWDPCAVVELGMGLSLGSPIGIIASDECLQGPLHFGVGSDLFYGGQNRVPMHLDVVLRGPATITPTAG